MDQIVLYISLYTCLEEGNCTGGNKSLSGHRETDKSFSRAGAPVLTHNRWKYQCSTSSPAEFVKFLKFCQPNGCEITSHYDSGSQIVRRVECLLTSLLAIWIFSSLMFCPFFCFVVYLPLIGRHSL